MASKTLCRLIASGTAAAAVWLAGSAAQAAYYVGAFDPQFSTGGAFSDLGYRGEARFFVPDACLLTDGPKLDGNTCSLGAMSLISAKVDLYRFSVGPGTLLATAILAPPVQSPDPVIGVNVQGGEVVGLDTQLVGPQFVTVADGQGQIYSGPVWLQFLTNCFSEGGCFQESRAYLWLGECRDFPICTAGPRADIFGVVRFTRISDPNVQIPEPSTFVLLLSALVAGWLLQQRRQAENRVRSHSKLDLF